MWRSFTWSQAFGSATFTGGTQYTSIFNVWGDPSAAMVNRGPGNPYELIVTVPGTGYLGSPSAGFGTRVYSYRVVSGASTMSYLIGSVLSFPWSYPSTTVGGAFVYSEVFSLNAP